MLAALLLALLALVGFIRFIHRTATDLQAYEIIQAIGARLRNGKQVNRGFDGLIDEVRLISRPLPVDEFLRGRGIRFRLLDEFADELFRAITAEQTHVRAPLHGRLSPGIPAHSNEINRSCLSNSKAQPMRSMSIAVMPRPKCARLVPDAALCHIDPVHFVTQALENQCLDPSPAPLQCARMSPDSGASISRFYLTRAPVM